LVLVHYRWAFRIWYYVLLYCEEGLWYCVKTGWLLAVSSCMMMVVVDYVLNTLFLFRLSLLGWMRRCVEAHTVYFMFLGWLGQRASEIHRWHGVCVLVSFLL
jgi:hypothetical protein